MSGKTMNQIRMEKGVFTDVQVQTLNVLWCEGWVPVEGVDPEVDCYEPPSARVLQELIERQLVERTEVTPEGLGACHTLTNLGRVLVADQKAALWDKK